MDTGQILTTVPATNVEKVRNFTKNPADFADLRLELQILILEVKTPFWSRLNPTSKSYIDEEMVKEVEISALLECSDGQTKEITFRVPIVDENTELPRFEQLEYHLTAEPCVLGRCVLAFETEIFIIDEDRDEENAAVEISTDCNEIEVLTNLITIEPWYANGRDSDGDGRLHKGFQTKVKLAFAPRNLSLEKSISFTIMAKNTKEEVKHEVIYTAKSNITITFEEFPGRILPPIFTSSFYYAQVEYFGEMVKVRPKEILAVIPWDNDSETNNIRYKFSGFPSVFLMDTDTGKMKFKSDLEETTLDEIRNSEITFSVTAERIKKVDEGESIRLNTASSSASIVIFFSNLNEDPTNSTTEYPCSPECYTTPTPFPGTCPITTCPSPEPCPGTTTILPTTYEPDPTTYPPEITTTTTVQPSTEETEKPPESTSSTVEPTTTTPAQTTPSSEPSTTLVTETSKYTSTIEPTTNPHESSTTPPQLSTTEEVTDSTTGFTTEPTSQSTTTRSTTISTSTTSPPTVTPQPGNCTCNCNRFSCQEPETIPSKNSTEYYEYPDPYNCTIYHRCSNETGSSSFFTCPTGKVYCPTNAACETVNDCLQLYADRGWWWKSGYGGGYVSSEESDEDSCEECECGRTPPGQRGNLCEESNFNGTTEEALEDPVYCDIFHKCVADGSGYHDYRMKCQVGLTFCKATNSCTWPNRAGCPCPSFKRFKQCDVCKMGGLEHFDIFKLRFTKGRVNH
ncbi:hypothetical protein Ocin01_09016 [Orchesella cincta]|uniref:Chitin-binding type-2 domain-containing protein n=1 Tax=Orchesella cincta TaxID=48709 RepID=A0A1D2MX96_ORCCI|nr:hypothetical protein Ocin01_09016 [Orchesella cincta]